MIVRSWNILVLASVSFTALGCALTWILVRLLRSNRKQILATGALLPEQEFAIREPGEVLLLLEAPRFGSEHRNFEFEMIEPATGTATKLKYNYARAQGATYGVGTARVPFGRVTLPDAAVYRVRVTGMQSGHDYSRYRILLSRPYLGRLVLQIIGIVICGIGMLLSLLFTLWQVLPLERG
jgi:hypothetical protein